MRNQILKQGEQIDNEGERHRENANPIFQGVTHTIGVIKQNKLVQEEKGANVWNNYGEGPKCQMPEGIPPVGEGITHPERLYFY